MTTTLTSPMTDHRRLFLLLWSGAMVNGLGSGMTAFAVAAVVFLHTNSATAVSAVLACALAPPMLLAPLTGVWADRYDRRLLMVVGDAAGAVGVALVWWQMSRGGLSVPGLCLAMAIVGITSALSEPAFRASITDLVAPESYDRSAALLQLLGAGRLLLAPLTAGLLLSLGGIAPILIIDIATIAVTVTCALIVRACAPRPHLPPQPARSLHREFLEGLAAIRAAHGVTTICLVFVVAGFGAGLAQVLFKPLMLPRISLAQQGIVESVVACGLLAGSGVVSAIAARRGRRFLLAVGLVLGGIALATLPHGSVWWVGAVGFGFFVTLAWINAGADALVRSRIPSHAQGRAWGVIALVSQIGFPLAYISAGPLVDHVTGINGAFLFAGALLIIGGVLVYRSSAIAAMEAVQ